MDYHPSNPSLDQLGELAAHTMSSLRAFFDEHNHHPSPEHWLALEDIARTMEAMAEGTCPRQVFLSAIDPGVGKSQTVIHFARALLSSAEHRNVGMIICVGRINEAVSLADALADRHDHIAVLTSDETANAKGNATPKQAQVLITTQQRIERATDRSSFEAVSSFHYRGSPRQVRVWDEAWLPGVPITLTGDDIQLLVKPIRQISSDFADALTELAVKLKSAADGEAVDVPDFCTAYGVTDYDILAAVGNAAGRLADEQQAAACQLIALMGHTVRVRRDGRFGTTMLSYRATMPADLRPIIVLDASGRVREAYGLIERHWGIITRLRSAVKDYSPLIVHVWPTSGGKTAFEERLPELAKGIADTILAKPTEQWLAVVHKTGGKIRDVEKAICRALPDSVSRNLAAITWGQHMATNAFADVPNVILAGTLFMRDSYYTALAHLAKRRHVKTGLVSRPEVEMVMRGEHAHMILQALCRGRVRKSDGAKCLPMDAYVIASSKSRIGTDITRIFPGCRVVPWRPVKKEPAGLVKKALNHVRSVIDHGETWVSFKSIWEALKVDRTNFRKWVLKKDDWKHGIDAMGLETAEGPRRAKGLRTVGQKARSQDTPPQVEGGSFMSPTYTFRYPPPSSRSQGSIGGGDERSLMLPHPTTHSHIPKALRFRFA